MRWFEQVISKNKVSFNVTSPPYKAKAQTVGSFLLQKTVADIETYNHVKSDA